jgi:hypothetical protein
MELFSIRIQRTFQLVSTINVISKHICNKIANKKMYFCSAKTDKEYCMEKAV